MGEVWGSPMKWIPSFSAVCLDLPSIPVIVRHNLVLSVLWSKLSRNSLHGLILSSDVALMISSFIVDSRGARRGPDCVDRLDPQSWPG